MEGRIPKLDDETENILKEEAMLIYLFYEDQIKSLFCEYHKSKDGKASDYVTWKEVE